MTQTNLKIGQPAKVLKQSNPTTPQYVWIPVMEELIGEVGMVHSVFGDDALLIFPNFKGLFAFENKPEVLKLCTNLSYTSLVAVTNTIPPRTDIDNVELEDFDIIDLNDTVGGENIFVVFDSIDLDIRYGSDLRRKYEYDPEAMLDGQVHSDLNSSTGAVFSIEQEWVIIGNLKTHNIERAIEENPYV